MPEEQSRRENSQQRKEVRTLLLAEDKSSISGSLGLLLKGLGVCLLIGLIIATVLTVCLQAIAGTSLIGWKGWLLAYIIVMAVVLIWLERRPQTVKLDDARRVIDPNLPADGPSQSSPIGMYVGSYASRVVWGPHAFLDGLRGMRDKRTLRQEAVFERAALLVLELAKTDGGVPIRQVLQPPEDMQVFGLAVDWLEPNGWIGKSSEGTSLWLSSTGRKKLVDGKLMPKPGAV